MNIEAEDFIFLDLERASQRKRNLLVINLTFSQIIIQYFSSETSSNEVYITTESMMSGKPTFL